MTDWLFFMMPRTGSRFISSILRNSLGEKIEIVDHIELYVNGEIEPRGLGKEHLWKFCFVREPYSRFLSAYRWIMRPRPRNKYDQKTRSGILRYRDVRRFCADLADFTSDPNNSPVHFCPQHKWIVAEKRNLTMDYLGKYENLDKSWMHITSVLGIDYQSILDENRTDFSLRKRLSRKMFDAYQQCRALSGHGLFGDEVREIVIDFYREDYSLFGYSFPG
jgi:hypothetical protein